MFKRFEGVTSYVVGLHLPENLLTLRDWQCRQGWACKKKTTSILDACEIAHKQCSQREDCRVSSQLFTEKSQKKVYISVSPPVQSSPPVQ